MVGLVGLVALLTVLFLSLVITRLASVALELTGLSGDAARFQARSAFTGTGFTTSEAEKVVDHPVRRRILMWLMITRSAGLVTIVISLILSFADAEGAQTRLYRLLWLAGGGAVLWLLSASRWVERGLNRIITLALRRWTDLDTADYVGLLHLEGDYTVHKSQLDDEDWLAGKTLGDCQLVEEGVMVLGIYREDGTYVGAPKTSTRLYEGDTLLLYGRGDRLKELGERRNDASGEAAHEKAVGDQRARDREQDRQEAEYQRTRDEEGAEEAGSSGD